MPRGTFACQQFVVCRCSDGQVLVIVLPGTAAESTSIRNAQYSARNNAVQSSSVVELCCLLRHIGGSLAA